MFAISAPAVSPIATWATTARPVDDDAPPRLVRRSSRKAKP
jgi:hypothetical protein